MHHNYIMSQQAILIADLGDGQYFQTCSKPNYRDIAEHTANSPIPYQYTVKGSSKHDVPVLNVVFAEYKICWISSLYLSTVQHQYWVMLTVSVILLCMYITIITLR